MKPLLFRSTQSGAPVLSGEVDKLIEVLSASLIINKAFAAVSGGSFLDRTTEARLEGGTAFTMFQTPGTSDEFYMGMPNVFDRAKFDVATAGTTDGTYVWEYWNGASWATLSVTDGTTEFSLDGTVTWTIPGSWATTSVNSVTQYWVRVRMTGVPSTNPTVNFVTITGWTEQFSNASKRVYRQGGGNGFVFRVQDDGASPLTDAKEATLKPAESASDVDTLSALFPTVAQVTNGLVLRKSTTADATARAWVVLADEKTCYLFMASGDTANAYIGALFGDFFSFVTGDSFRTVGIARTVLNSGAAGNEHADKLSAFGAVNTGHYAARPYTGLGTSKQVGKHGDGDTGSQSIMLGTMTYPNPADGGLYLAPIHVHEGVDTILRGRLRGLWHQQHAIASFADGDTFQMGSKTFLILKQTQNAGAWVLETSDTWESN